MYCRKRQRLFFLKACTSKPQKESSMELKPKCRITVLQRSVNKSLIDAYMDEKMRSYSVCSKLKDGEQFLVTSEFEMPSGFCPWAWADIRKDILSIIHGASYDWYKEKNMTIAGCTDWFKPVLFKIEKL